MSPVIRDARDGDADGLIALIGACWSEYPGCILDVDGELPELRRIASHFAAQDGRFWVGEDQGKVVASVGLLPVGKGGAELCKLYVDAAARRHGLGGSLVRLVEEEARQRGACFVELWSDTRFRDAHRLYERLGYARGRETRVLHDLSNSIEYHYRKVLAP